ncbi:hypothetical protein [Tolypothrix sp. VBCCA 56010]
MAPPAAGIGLSTTRHSYPRLLRVDIEEAIALSITRLFHAIAYFYQYH